MFGTYLNNVFLLSFVLFLASCDFVTKSSSELLTDIFNPTDKLSISLIDYDSSNTDYTDDKKVKVEIQDDDGAVAWCITETITDNSDDLCPNGLGLVSGWFDERPTEIDLSQSEGLKKIYLKIKDVEGNIITRVISQTIYLDATPPLVTLSSPPNITTLNIDSYTLGGTCSESNPVEVSVNSYSYTAACNNGVWSKVLDFSGVADGAVTFNVVQEDSAGNVSPTITATVLKDATPVVIIPTSPTDGYYINIANKNSLNLAGACTEDGNIQVTGDITDTISCSGGVFSANYNPSAWVDGDKSITLNMQDALGNAADPVTISFKKDTVLPSFNLTSASNGDYVNQASAVGFKLKGTCSEEGINIIVSGDITTGITCVSGAFEQDVDLSGLVDGSISISLDFKDAAGNSAGTQSLNLVKDTVAPVLTQTSYVSGSSSNLDQITFGGVCDAASALNVVGADNASLTCSSSVWTHTVDAQTSDGTYGYTFSQTDGAGNTASIVVSWVRDTTAPSVNVVSIEGGAGSVSKLNVSVSVNVSDISDITHVRLANANLATNDCQSEYADDYWKAYSSGEQIFSHTLLPGEGPKKVCVWAKDVAGNISAIVPSTGLIGTNADTITYLKDQVPTVDLLTVSNNTAGSNFGTKTFNLGDDVKIQFAASDLEGLKLNPVSLYYTTDSKEWFSIVKNIGGTGGTSMSGTYNLFKAPSSGFFQIMAIVEDESSNFSVPVISESLNTGNWSVYAGTSSDGIGGGNESVQLSKATFGVAYGQLAVHPVSHDMYFVSYGKGIIKGSAQTGVSSYFIYHGTDTLISSTNMTDKPEIPTGTASLRFDKSGRLYVNHYGSISRIDLETGEIKSIIKRGSNNVAPYSFTDVAILPQTSFDIDEDNNIYFGIDCEIASGVWNNDFNNTLKIAKATYDADSDTYTSIDDIAGNCNLATPTFGENALTQGLGNYRYRHLLNLTVNADASAIYFGTINTIYKIVGGKIYDSSLGGAAGIYADKTQEVIWNGNGALYKVTDANLPANNSHTSEKILEKGGGTCNDNGTEASSACVNLYHGNGAGEAVAAWSGQLYFIDSGPRVRILNSSDNKIYTQMGTQFFYGDGLDKQFIRPSSVKGLYYKKPSEANQAAFPAGLYFTDALAMTVNYIDPDTGKAKIVAGNQYLANSVDPVFSNSSTFGRQAQDINLNALSFDSDGLPWLVLEQYLYKVESDYSMTKVQTTNATWSRATQGDNPHSRIGRRGMLAGNLTFYKNEGIFVIGNGQEPNSRTHSGVIQYHDYKNDIVQHLIGGQTIDIGVGYCADNSTPGATVNLTLDADCNNQLGWCHTLYNETDDRLYFSEDTKIRYLDNPRNPAATTLATLIDTGVDMSGFIFHPTKEQIYYVKESGGRLYCIYYGTGSGSPHCNNTDLGPPNGYKSLPTRYTGNKMTWKSDTELLISTDSSEIFQFTLPD
ncbi:MAG: hypothetical protein VX642_05905 [Bdellovibrionota bacterium]|nr:hypothetical protein [Bdellovibrionota bacterium]